MEEFSNTYLQKKILILFGNDIGSLSLHWIYNCNEYKFGKKGINDETIRTIIRP